MSERKSRESMGRAGKRVFALATLAALVLALAGSSRAQAQSAASKSAPASTSTSSKVATVNTTPGTQAATPKPAAEPAAPAGQSAPKGQHEGITVHGHWTIEVRNPDGKVVSHTEFENALSPGFTLPYPFGSFPVASGEALLSAMMTGQAATPIDWSIILGGPGGFASTTGAPCVAALFVPQGFCVLVQNNSPFAMALGQVCSQTPIPAGWSCNLAVSALGTAPNLSGFQLSGSVIATQQQGTISAVATMDWFACGPGGTNANCPFSNNGGIAAFTAKPLDGNTPAGATAGDPLPVPVSAGQTVAVTVAIGFQ